MCETVAFIVVMLHVFISAICVLRSRLFETVIDLGLVFSDVFAYCMLATDKTNEDVSANAGTSVESNRLSIHLHYSSLHKQMLFFFIKAI